MIVSRGTLCASLLVLCGCDPPMPNEQIIAETQKCEAAGMRAVPLRHWASSDRIFAVECRPLEPFER